MKSADTPPGKVRARRGYYRADPSDEDAVAPEGRGRHRRGRGAVLIDDERGDGGEVDLGPGRGHLRFAYAGAWKEATAGPS